ncbi:NAD-dependent succinate-semialdehyde dehydrogenase [Micromonospora sp. NPDC048830]|uniref:NAD-dependent succinate-semialdehyde dehydrogenase n=1 Tax=Micromonospora sp. NPDC048830 TaxID=3364257 RepID=UPI00371591A3
MAVFVTVDPRTADVLAEHPLLSEADIASAVNRSADAFPDWALGKPADRSPILRGIAELHRARKEELAASMAREMGKPVAQGRGEVELAASIFDYYGDRGPDLLADEELEVAGGGRALVRTAPLGAILGIMPWNYPLYQVARFVAPNLVLGNTILLKHARACAATSVILADIVRDAGAPAGVYENLLITSDQVAGLIADPRVRGVSLTGSERAGREVGELAGRNLKKSVLELGGSDPFIVLPDADIDEVLGFAENGRFSNAGQSCTSAKRMIVHSTVWEEFLGGLVERAKGWQLGDPLLDETRLGPMASVGGRDEVAEIVEDAVRQGATAHVGAEIPDGAGAFYPATVLTGVVPGMRAYHEEIFGPVAVVYEVDSVDAAIELANDTPFGLGASVFTRDLELANTIANRLDVGMVGLNTTIRSQPNLPFGGVKASGLGRELGRFGLDEFSNKKLLRIVAGS